MIPRNQFVNSEPVADQPRDDGDHEDYNLENWNDTPPHENGEGWDGNGFGAGIPGAGAVTLPGLEPGPEELPGQEGGYSVATHTQRETNTESTTEEAETYSYVSP